MLSELVRECALVYLEDEHIEIRKAAAVTTCQLLAQDPICYEVLKFFDVFQVIIVQAIIFSRIYDIHL